MATIDIERHLASNGSEVFRLPLEVFPDYHAFAHLVIHEGHSILVDVGSGLGHSHRDLEAAFTALGEKWGTGVSLADIERIVITHGHIDHFGGLPAVAKIATHAQIACHELAQPVLTNYTERRMITIAAMRDFFQRAGAPADRIGWMLDMYDLGKGAYTEMPVHQALRDGDWIDGVMQVIHVPGHAPGLIMLRCGDLLLTADHILPGTSVALWPESILPYTGVGHYIESLEKALRLEGIRVALGGHERTMPDFYDVAQNTLMQAREKVRLVHDMCKEPRTIYEIARLIYGELEGYSTILKLSQVGARIEYLNQRGLVRIANLEALGRPAEALCYVAA